MTDWLMQDYPAFIVMCITSDDIFTHLHVIALGQDMALHHFSSNKLHYYVLSLITCHTSKLSETR